MSIITSTTRQFLTKFGRLVLDVTLFCSTLVYWILNNLSDYLQHGLKDKRYMSRSWFNGMLLLRNLPSRISLGNWLLPSMSRCQKLAINYYIASLFNSLYNSLFFLESGWLRQLPQSFQTFNCVSYALYFYYLIHSITTAVLGFLPSVIEIQVFQCIVMHYTMQHIMIEWIFRSTSC